MIHTPWKQWSTCETFRISTWLIHSFIVIIATLPFWFILVRIVPERKWIPHHCIPAIAVLIYWTCFHKAHYAFTFLCMFYKRGANVSFCVCAQPMKDGLTMQRRTHIDKDFYHFCFVTDPINLPNTVNCHIPWMCYWLFLSIKKCYTKHVANVAESWKYIMSKLALLLYHTANAITISASRDFWK